MARWEFFTSQRKQLVTPLFIGRVCVCGGDPSGICSLLQCVGEGQWGRGGKGLKKRNQQLITLLPVHEVLLRLDKIRNDPGCLKLLE